MALTLTTQMKSNYSTFIHKRGREGSVCDYKVAFPKRKTSKLDK